MQNSNCVGSNSLLPTQDSLLFCRQSKHIRSVSVRRPMCANRLGSGLTVDVGVEPQVIVPMIRSALRDTSYVSCTIGLANHYVAVCAIVFVAVHPALPSITSVAPIRLRCRSASCQGCRHQAEREDENEGERQNHP